MTSYIGRGNKNAVQKNPSSGIDDELYRGNNKAFRIILQVALEELTMTSYTGAITRLSEESFKWH